MEYAVSTGSLLSQLDQKLRLFGNISEGIIDEHGLRLFQFLDLNCVRLVRQEALPRPRCEDFFFRLPERSPLPLGDYPPSIRTNCSSCDCSKKMPRESGDGGRITYSLKVGLWIRDHNLVTHTEEIILTPSGSPCPPICIQDFPNDYISTRNKILKRSMKKTSTILEVSVAEPPPIEFSPNTGMLHTTLDLTMTYKDSSLQDIEVPRLGFESCEVRLRLKARNIVSSRLLAAEPTAFHVKRSAHLSETTEEYNMQIMTLNLPKWELKGCEETPEENGMYC